MVTSIVGFHFFIRNIQNLLAFKARIFFSIKNVEDLYRIFFFRGDLLVLRYTINKNPQGPKLNADQSTDLLNKPENSILQILSPV